MSVISTVIAGAQALPACPGPAIYGSAVSSESLDPMARRIRVEVCVEVCVDRVELCAALEVGGITPSAGMIRSCREALEIPIMVMLRPRAGDFVYSEAEFAILCADLVIAKDLGANGIVIGMLTSTGEVNKKHLEEILQRARPMSVTFHRAFDMMPDPLAAISVLADLGIDRDNVRALVADTAVEEVHVGSACRVVRPSQMSYKNQDISMGRSRDSDEYLRQMTSTELVRAIVSALH